MKKLLCLFLSLIFAFAFVGCTYSGIEDDDPSLPPTGGGSGGTIEFSVELELNGEKFTKTQGIKAIWSNRQGVYEAMFDENSTAKVKGPDGDYKVTLENLPDGYAYDPNAHYATNNMSEISIKIYELNYSTKDGSDLYGNIIEVRKEGVYRTTLNNRNHIVYYEFQPRISGKYEIQSWVDVTFNEVNPFVDIYYGNVAAKFFDYTCNEGGVTDTYTRNFRYEVSVSDSELQNVFAFGIHATHKTNQFPVTIDFIIHKIDEQPDRVNNPEMLYPSHDFSKPFTWDTGVWTWAEGNDNRFNEENNFILASDGFYHLKDADGSVSDKKLYVMISQSINERPFNSYQGSNVGLYTFTLNIVPSNPLQNIKGLCYNEFIKEYNRWANSDGVYPVTKEMRDFLQAFAISQRYFADGEGWFETQTGVYALENEQWLFACGYYI